MILAIESSCDETAAALVDDGGRLLSSVVASQAELHARYGGVVPEVASRRHLELCVPVVERALDDAGVGFDRVDAVAVTEGPGLIGALLVGLATAKALAFARRLPLIPVGHLHGHVASLYLEPEPLAPPFLVLLASGGHTLLAEVDDHGPGMRVVGQTLDDAAGEALRQGRAPARPRLSRRRRARAAGPRRRRPRATSSPWPWPAARASTSRSAASRPPCAPPCWPPAPDDAGRADLAASYQRRSGALAGVAHDAGAGGDRPRHAGRGRRRRGQRRAARRARAGVRARRACGWRWHRSRSAPTTPP